MLGMKKNDQFKNLKMTNLKNLKKSSNNKYSHVMNGKIQKWKKSKKDQLIINSQVMNGKN
jgi:hypothetical protein